jgi:hypothetical protein
VEKVIFIEVHDQHGKLVERFKATTFPVRVGRAYDNDLIVDDPYVCPHHCEVNLDEAGRVVITDLASVNGTYAASSKFRSAQVVMDEAASNRQLKIGHTQLGFRLPGDPVAPARIDGASLGRAQWPPRSLVITVPLLLFAALVMMLSAYLDSYKEFDFGHYFFKDLIPAVLGVAGWAAIWAIVSRITMHRFSFLRHATVLVTIILFSSLSEYLLNILKFGFAREIPFEYVGVVLLVIAITLLLFWHLRLSSEQSQRRLLSVSALFAIVMVGLIQIDSYLDNKGFRSSPNYSTLLELPQLQLVSSKGVDDFLNEDNALRKEIEQEIMSDSSGKDAQREEAVVSK